jgi:hypothetical protein
MFVHKNNIEPCSVEKAWHLPRVLRRLDQVWGFNVTSSLHWAPPRLEGKFSFSSKELQGGRCPVVQQYLFYKYCRPGLNIQVGWVTEIYLNKHAHIYYIAKELAQPPRSVMVIILSRIGRQRMLIVCK